MLPYESLMALSPPPFRIAWTERDVMLHAVAVGMGRHPADPRELPYVYERNLTVLPSFLSVLEKESAPARLDLMQVELERVLHAGQEITVHSPLPTAGSLIGTHRIVEAYDKGDRGAVVLEEVTYRDEATGDHIATSTSTMFVRDHGHFGGSTAKAPPPTAQPDRPADHRAALMIRPEQAALFRLLGDRNPLHIDPAVARGAGFEQPILHGLCSLGMAAQGVLAGMPDVTSDDFLSFGASFAGFVYPGETLVLSAWREPEAIYFVADVAEREAPVLKNGRIRLRAD
jgi:acyl dehydratase